MQKIINVMKLVLSFLGTASMIGGGYYLYTQKDAYIETAKEKVTEAIMEAIPKMIDSMMPEIPEPEIPMMPSQTGGVINAKPALPF